MNRGGKQHADEQERQRLQEHAEKRVDDVVNGNSPALQKRPKSERKSYRYTRQQRIARYRVQRRMEDCVKQPLFGCFGQDGYAGVILADQALEGDRFANGPRVSENDKLACDKLPGN